MTRPTLEPEQIRSQSAAEYKILRLPQRHELFRERAARLEQLAPGHPLGQYLLLIARVAQTQHWMLESMPAIMPPSADMLAKCREHGMPPLGVQTLRRDPQWCDMLRRMLRRLASQMGGVTREVILRLDAERDEFYEAQASKLLAGITVGVDPATAPFIAAALQVVWTQLATVIGEEAIGASDVPTLCPVCGSRPVASIVRSGPGEAGQRYLHCSVCAAEWHMVRIKCTSCESTEGVHYHGIEGEIKSVQAESCDKCDSYLKILHMERDPQVEPTADDLASLALDLLMSDTGKMRSGQNLMLIHGEGE
jgi:FdhE protein